MDETITIPKGCLKTRTKRFMVYDIDWLLEHLEMEFLNLKNYRAVKDDLDQFDMNKFRKAMANEDNKG